MDDISNIPTTWRYQHIKNYIELTQINHPELNNIYQFGLWTCRSMIDFMRMNINVNKYYGFDSFEGLPDERGENLYEDFKKYGVTDWCKGMYSSKSWFGVDTVELAMAKSRELLELFAPSEKIELIPGFWEDILTPELMKTHNFGPALYIDVDGDIYASTIDCLNFVFSNNIVRPNTLIGYDDWGSPGYQNFETGESRAHKEITEKYDVKWAELYTIDYGIGNVQKLFKVVSYANNCS